MNDRSLVMVSEARELKIVCQMSTNSIRHLGGAWQINLVSASK
jgi:hypothetical protein